MECRQMGCIRAEVGRMGIRPPGDHLFQRLWHDPEMRQYYRSAFWFIPERLGYKRRRVSEAETVSDVSFNSNPGQQTETRFTANR